MEFLLAGWAWSLGVVVMLIQLAGHVLRLISGNGATGSIIGIIIAGGILLYLFTPGVKAAFGKTSAIV